MLHSRNFVKAVNTKRAGFGTALLFGTFLSCCSFSNLVSASELISAIRNDDLSHARSLINAESVNTLGSDGTSALMWAINKQDMPLVEALLEAGADVNIVNEYGSSAMMEVMLKSNNDMLKLLLNHGANADWRNYEGESALMLAARSGNLEAAELLLKNGADVNAIESWGGQSALMWATAQGQTALMELLIKHGADVNARSEVRLWDRRITSEPRPKDMNKGGFTPLLYAARQGCIECARILVKAGANINETDPDRVSVISLALMNAHFDFAAYLIEEGASANTWDLFGRTPLYFAVDMNTLPQGGRSDIPQEDVHSGLDIVRMLLAKGANPNSQLKMRPPYRQAVSDRRNDHILSYGATPLMRAAKASDNETIKLLLDAGAIVDLPNWMGVTPFMVAAGVGRTETPSRGLYVTEAEALSTLELLLAAGADINAQTASYKGKWSEMEDDRPFFNDYPFDGQTALHGAAKLGWNQVVQWLVDHGSVMQVPDINGDTALDLAYGRYEPAYLLPPPLPLPETIELLESLCAASDTCQLPANGDSPIQ